jgi:DNA-binding response OmpR family regulator
VAPLIVLNAVAAEEVKVRVLDNGADDYIVKPLGLRELLARIHAVLRRAGSQDSMTIRFGDVEVNLTRRVVLKRGDELELTRTEYNLLTFFLRNPDRTLERDLILNLVWGYEWFRQTRTLDSHVGRLRKKLEPDASNPSHFLTVHGVGYRFLP